MNLQSATDIVLDLLKKSEKGKHAYPFQRNVAQGLKKGFVGIHDRWIVTLVEPAPGVIRASMSDTEDQRATQLTLEARTEAELRQGMTLWIPKIHWWRERLSVYRLQPGKTYRVVRRFVDYTNAAFEPGTELTFVKQNFLPYDGGYTLTFQSMRVYLQEEANADILDNFDAYFVEVG